jgi:hypothetical protein
VAGPVSDKLRERIAARLISSATTFGLDCLEMRENARRAGARLSAFDPMFQVIVLHEWLSNTMIRAAEAITPRPGQRRSAG